MLKKIILFFVMLFSGVSLYAGNFFITPTEIDLGEIKWKTEKEFAIKLVNKSDRVVKIEKILNLCSYIKVYRNKKQHILLPGKEIDVKVKYFGGSMGYFGKVIKIYTDYPNWKEVSINVKGKVVPPQKFPKLEIDKKSIDIGSINLGEEKGFIVKLRNSGNDDLKVKLHGFNSPKLDKPIIIPPGKAGEFYYKFVAKTSGNINNVIWVTSNDPNNSNVPIAVTGKVSGRKISEGQVDFNLKKTFPVIAFFTGLSFLIYGGIKFFS